jgi:chemotaxis protein methyltransferase CheR
MTVDRDYELFKQKVKVKIGLDLSSYKEQQMRRRINQLMQRYNMPDYAEFLQLLNKDPLILKHFTDYLTINTSQFFRDPAVYQALETELLPALLKKGESVKIWSAGCSIGAEPYSLAILLQDKAPGGDWRILATDFDLSILDKAKIGKYPENTLSKVPLRFRQRHFTEQDGQFILDERIKSLIQFRQQNLLTDRFETNCDIILCRNVFIYFTVETQDALITRFSQSLKPDGYFIIGCSEMIADPTRFKLKKVKPAIYQKIS